MTTRPALLDAAASADDAAVAFLTSLEAMLTIGKSSGDDAALRAASLIRQSRIEAVNTAIHGTKAVGTLNYAPVAAVAVLDRAKI